MELKKTYMHVVEEVEIVTSVKVNEVGSIHVQVVRLLLQVDCFSAC